MLFRTRDHRGLDGDLQAGGDRRRTRSRAGAERRMAALRLSCLARNGRSPGEESLTAAVAAQAIEAKPSSGQISQGEAVVARRRASSGEDVADAEGPAQESRHTRRRERGRSVGKGGVPIDANQSNDMPSHRAFVGRAEIGAAWSKQSDEAGTTSPSSSTTRASRRLSSPTCSMIRMARATP
jgi:hypothetical protein